MAGSRADLVLTGGKVWAGAGTPPAGAGAPTALAATGGRVLAVGGDREVDALAAPDARRIPLEGRRVVPGLMDAHTHFLRGGLELAGLRLRDAATPAELARRIGERARERPGEWITGGGWDHERWGGELPRREWIDPVTPHTPAFVERLDMHMGLANTRALELAGIGERTPDPPGGVILRDEDGRPTGILKETARALVRRAIPPPADEELERALEAAGAHALARGVTLLTDVGTDLGWRGLAVYRRARAAGRLPLRVHAAVPLEERGRLADLVAREGRGDARLRWGAVKAFVDGSLGAGTAWFHAPYADDPGNHGLVVSDLEELRRGLAEADAAGLQPLVHAIGDRAVDWLLDAYAAICGTGGPGRGPGERRFRIEHAQHLTPRAIRRIAAHGLIASMQPYHVADDGRWAERRLGPDRIRAAYPFRDLLDAGARLAFGSDWTVAPLDPFLGVWAAVTRRTMDGTHPEGWVPEQRIGVEEALAAYTAGVAYAAGLEGTLGFLAPGRRADLVVLSEDPFAVEPARLDEVRPDLTVVDGKVAFRRPTT